MAGLSLFSALWHSAAREPNASASHTKAGICFLCRIPMTPAVCRHRHKAPAPRFSTPGPSEAHPQIRTVEAAGIVLGQRECAQLSPCPTLHEVRESTSAALRSGGPAMPHQPLPGGLFHYASTCLYPSIIYLSIYGLHIVYDLSTCHLSVICPSLRNSVFTLKAFSWSGEAPPHHGAQTALLIERSILSTDASPAAPGLVFDLQPGSTAQGVDT